MVKEEKKTPYETPKLQIENQTLQAYLLAILIPLVCLVGPWTTPALANPTLLKAATLQFYMSVLLVFWCWRNRHASYFSLHYSNPRLLFLVLFAFGSLSILWSVNIDFFINKWLMWYFGALMFFFILKINHSMQNLSIILGGVVLGGVVTSVVGIGQFLFLFELLPQNYFPASTFGNANIAGQIIVLCFPAAFYFLLKWNKNKSTDWMSALAIALMLAYAVYTSTRGVWIAIFIEIVLMILFILIDKLGRRNWLYWNTNKTRASLVGLLLLAVLLNVDSQGFRPFSTTAADQISSLASSVANPQSERYWLWGSTWKMIEQTPIVGNGLGSWLEVFNQGYYRYHNWGVQRAHNDLLELGAELGFAGLLIALAIFVHMTKLVLNLANQVSGPQRLSYAVTFIALSGTVANAQVSFPYQLQLPIIIMCLYVALLIRGEEEITPPENLKVKPLSLPRGFSAAAVAFSIIILLLTTTLNGQWFRAHSELSNNIENPDVSNIFRPDFMVFHQELIPVLRSLSMQLHHQGSYRIALSLTPLLTDYWPQEPINVALLASLHLSLGNYEEVEKLVKTTKGDQPDGSYFFEHLLIKTYLAQANKDKLRDVYNYLSSQPEDKLQQRNQHYLTLHFLSVELNDYSRTKMFYDLYLKYFLPTAELESNMVSHYMNAGLVEKALPHMATALELNPNVNNADRMRIFLKERSK